MPDPRPIPTPDPDAKGVHAAIAVSRYNAWITDALLEGARAEFGRLGGDPEHLIVLPAPGAWELPSILAAALRTGRFDCAVALGCIIRGETSHDRHIADAVAQSLMTLSIQSASPVAFGILTVQTPEQAEARAGGAKGNKGAEAMRAALDTLASIRLAGEAR